jgi:hypothetical protein
LEQQKLQADIEMQRAQLEAETQLKREQMAAEMQLKREQMMMASSMSTNLSAGDIRFGGEVG